MCEQIKQGGEEPLVFQFNKGLWFKNANTWPGGQVACCYVGIFFST